MLFKIRIKKLFKSFSKNIWKTAIEQANYRAIFYKNLYDKIKNTPIQKKDGVLLDVAGGDLKNTIEFRRAFVKVISLDISFSKDSIERANLNNLNLILADGHFIPFKNEYFKTITMISVIEHVEYPELVLKEVIRVLKSGGELIIQFPNKMFPIEPHTGLLFIYYFPYFIRKRFLKLMGYEYYLDYVYSFPTMKMIHKWLKNKCFLTANEVVILPSLLVPSLIRPLYKLLVKLGILKIIPQSWFVIYNKY